MSSPSRALLLRVLCALGLPGVAAPLQSGCSESHRDLGALLDPIPAPDGGYPVCTGEETMFTGPCCQDVHCYTPEGGAACPSSEAVALEDLGVSAPGSGVCACGTTGPFSSEGAERYTSSVGECCYVVGTMGCTGRPLVIGGEVRVAALLSSSAWT